MARKAAARVHGTATQFIQRGIFGFCIALFNTASSAASQIPPIRRGLTPKLLRLWHWQSDALTIRLYLNLMHIRLDLIHSYICTLSWQDVVSCFPERSACLCWSFLINNPGHRGFFLSGKFKHFYRKKVCNKTFHCSHLFHPIITVEQASWNYRWHCSFGTQASIVKGTMSQDGYFF